MKIINIVGARPQFIKLSGILREILNRGNIQSTTIHTGQHYDRNMSDIFFKQMQIPLPDYNLNINEQLHGVMTGKMLEGIETILIKEKPDWVLVYGDTNSTLAGALAAVKLHIKVGHVEAGLRSYNMKMPEEVNRILTDRMSKLLFCPTITAEKNLINEGFQDFDVQIVKSGDIMYDSSLYYNEYAQKPKSITEYSKEFILLTIHRAENTDNIDRLVSIFKAMNSLSKINEIIFPIHPRTMNIIKANQIKVSPRINLIEPVGYLSMIWLISNCKVVMTDSGGLQKEAYFFKKPCITLRDETEWVELVENGFNIITGANTNTIISSYHNLTDIDWTRNTNLYGNGKASTTIIEKVIKYV